jgi:amino acid permease
MTNPYPHELSIGDVYYSPLLLVAFLAFVAALITVMLLNKLKLTRYLAAPSYVFIAIMALYIVLIDTFWIKF